MLDDKEPVHPKAAADLFGGHKSQLKDAGKSVSEVRMPAKPLNCT